MTESYFWAVEPPDIPPLEDPPGFIFEPEAWKPKRSKLDDQQSALSRSISKPLVEQGAVDGPVGSEASPFKRNFLSRYGTRENPLRMDGTYLGTQIPMFQKSGSASEKKPEKYDVTGDLVGRGSDNAHHFDAGSNVGEFNFQICLRRARGASR